MHNRSELLLGVKRSPRRTYLAAIAFSGVFVPLGILLEIKFDTGFRVALLSILFSSWYGGIGPGLLAALMTTAPLLIFISRTTSFIVTTSDGIYFATFVVLALLISVLNGSLYAANLASQEYAAQRERFIAVISHEIRTPLNGVIGMTELLERSGLSRLQKDYLATLRISANTLMSLVNNTLDFSKLRSRTVELAKESFVIEEQVREVLKRNEDLARKSGLDLVSWFSPQLPPRVAGDPGRLKQVLSNLLDNAVKFTQKGAVSISVKPIRIENNKAEIRFEVADTGVGIAREAQDRVFDVFVQAASGETQKGVGLGLAICKELVSLMGGEIDVKSKQGEGTTFSFSLPLEIAPTDLKANDIAEESSSLEPWAVHQGAKVLAVDDNDCNLDVVKAMLEHLGVPHSTASSGEAALQALGSDFFSLVLLDIYMPGMGGERTFSEIKRLYPRTEICMFSADNSPFLRQRLLQEGAVDYLLKPLTLSVLTATLVKAGTASGDWKTISPMKSEERFKGLYTKYLSELPGRLSHIQNIASTDDSAALSQSVHALKSVSLVLGVNPITEACSKIESAADQKELRESLEILAVESVKTAIHLGRIVEQPA